MISGGSENALVIWQMDTGKQNFLPHLSGSVENVTVSGRGALYGVHLDDNSAMVLSTAELQPTCYVAGVQSAVTHLSTPKDQLVKRVWTSTKHPLLPVATAICPKDTSKLHLCVGSVQQSIVAGTNPATPWLQSIDLVSLRSLDKQAIARTQLTDVTITNKGKPIIDPRVSHMVFSVDGAWLATVDEWEPAPHDIQEWALGAQDLMKRQRREVFLKFWEVKDDGQVGLVSRINSPHSSPFAERVLDLAAESRSNSFATLGADGKIRSWIAKSRELDDVAAGGGRGEDSVKWVCRLTVDLGATPEDELFEMEQDLVADDEDPPQESRETAPSGALAFSEDGSTLFAAFGNTEDGLVYVIDVKSGQICHTIQDLWQGEVCRMECISRYLITLSNHLRVYDVVAGELSYGIRMPEIQSAEFLQLAADVRSGFFAVSVPAGDSTDVAVYSTARADPVLLQSLESRVVSLTSTPETSGFLVLDDMAQISTLSEVSQADTIQVAQTLEEMQLDKVPNGDKVPNRGVKGAGGKEIEVAMEDDDDEEDDDDDEDVGGNGDEMDVDDEAHAAVVSREGLGDIFSGATAPIEELFFKVTGMIAPKPVVV